MFNICFLTISLEWRTSHCQYRNIPTGNKMIWIIIRNKSHGGTQYSETNKHSLYQRQIALLLQNLHSRTKLLRSKTEQPSITCVPVQQSLPRPPGGAAGGSALVFDRRAQWREAGLCHVHIRGRLPLAEALHHTSVLLYLHLLPGQEVLHLLDAPGVAPAGSRWIDSPTLLLQSS